MRRIEEARNMRGMSQAKLAEAMGTSPCGAVSF